MNKKLFSTILLMIWSLSVLFYLGNNLVQVSDLYANKQMSLLARNLAWFFFSCIIIVLLGSGIFAFYKKELKELLKIIIFAISSTFLFYKSYIFSAEILNDFRTYSYEILIVSFYFWAASILSIFCAVMIFNKSYKKLLSAGVLLTVSAIVVFIFEGRGSIEHINLLIGGLFAEKSWEMFSKSSTINMLYFMLIAVASWSLLYITACWIKSGTIVFASIKHNVKMFIVFILLISFTTVSIPAGNSLNESDIKDAQKFVVELINKVDEYYKVKGEYPRDLKDIGVDISKNIPRLLDIFQYLAYGYEGAYYFSRPEKFCFVFQDPGKGFGYYSITNERKWRYSHSGAKLEDEFVSVCDDGGPRSHERLMASHLGISDFKNPIDELAMELNQDVKTSQSMLAAEQLDKEITELGSKNPYIYGDSKPIKDLPERSIDDLRFSIMTGKLEDIEPFSVKQYEDADDVTNDRGK